MPQGTAAARTQLTDRTLNNSANVKGGQTVTLTLHFADGRTFVPEDLWDALITRYGAGKVENMNDTNARNLFNWKVLA